MLSATQNKTTNALNEGRRSSQSADQDVLSHFDAKKSSWRKSTISLITSPGNNDSTTTVKKTKLSSLKKTRNNEKQAMPTPTISLIGKAEERNENDEALKRLNEILERIDMSRQLLGRVRNAEYPELVGFEACMLYWEAILKVFSKKYIDSFFS